MDLQKKKNNSSFFVLTKYTFCDNILNYERGVNMTSEIYYKLLHQLNQSHKKDLDKIDLFYRRLKRNTTKEYCNIWSKMLKGVKRCKEKMSINITFDEINPEEYNSISFAEETILKYKNKPIDVLQLKNDLIKDGLTTTFAQNEDGKYFLSVEADKYLLNKIESDLSINYPQEKILSKSVKSTKVKGKN